MGTAAEVKTCPREVKGMHRSRVIRLSETGESGMRLNIGSQLCLRVLVGSAEDDRPIRFGAPSGGGTDQALAGLGVNARLHCRDVGDVTAHSLVSRARRCSSSLIIQEASFRE